MITHHCISVNINREVVGQYQKAVFDPLPAMLETATALTVLATQKYAAYTTRHAMVLGSGLKRQQ